jgi:CRISPR-associated protein Cas1
VIKRTIEISEESLHLAVELDQLRLYRHEPESGLAATIPCEDVGLRVVDHPQATFSHAALSRLMEFGAAVVVCGRNHLPSGLLLPLGNHSEGVARLQEQIRASRPLRKRLWKQIVRAKVRNQAANLAPDSVGRRRLLALADEVKSGDPANIEAQAAKIYWGEWLGADSGFRRDLDGGDAVNAMLNYGYAVVRAAVGRALVAAGLHPALGIQHSNRSNAFCLADDLLEPLRPFVDRVVRGLHEEGAIELNRQTKAKLLGLLTATVRVGGQEGPLMVALHQTAASLVGCYQGREKRLLLPQEGRPDVPCVP